jgi:tetratricopeptide (TPR) repeat protein
MKGRYEEALAELKKSLELSPNNYYSQIGLVAAYSMLGQEEQARTAVKKLLKMEPNFTTRSLSKLLPYKNQVDLKRFLDAVRKAGLRE